jgi:hypothetical protein
LLFRVSRPLTGLPLDATGDILDFSFHPILVHRFLL